MNACWLCQYTHTADAKTYGNFIVENMGCASVHSIAEQVSEDLRTKYPDAEGTDVETCCVHIEHHTLHPICRIATMLRSLLRLSDEMEQNVRKCDEDGNSLMDPKMLETYLKLQGQILQIYRISESSKLLFSERSL